MGKATRNRAIRRRALIVDPTGKRTRSIARALRRHGRFPLDMERERPGSRPAPVVELDRERPWLKIRERKETQVVRDVKTKLRAFMPGHGKR